MRFKKCRCCDESIKNEEDLEFFIDYSVKPNSKKRFLPIHQSCLHDDESEPILQVAPIGNNPDFDNLEYSGYGFSSYGVGYYHNWTDGLFNFGYSKTDQWRGSYDPYSEKYTEIDQHHITFGYESDHPGYNDELEQQKKTIEKIIKDNNLRAVYVVSRTSNCLSSGLTYFVHNDDLSKYNNAILELEQQEQENNYVCGDCGLECLKEDRLKYCDPQCPACKDEINVIKEEIAQ